MKYKILICTIIFTISMGIQGNTLCQQSYHYYVPTLIEKQRLTTKNLGENLESVLGEGWSSDNEAAVGQCLLGSVDHVGTPAGYIGMDTVYQYDDVMNQLNFKTEGNFSVPGFKVDSVTNYAHMLKDTDYSQTFIYRAAIFLKNRHFSILSDKSPLTWVGQQYINNPINFRAYCGDKFISEQKIGGFLYVAVKFLFHTVKEKTEFNSKLKISVASLANLSAELSTLATSMKIAGNIALMAFQIGGDPSKLGQILGAKLGSTETSLLNCELKHLETCKQVINQILNYATQSEKNNFPAQFSEDSPQTPTGPGVLQDIFQNYQMVVPVNIGPSLVTADIIQARARLSQKYEQSIEQDNEVTELLNNGISLSPEYTEKLGVLKTQIGNNTKLLIKAGMTCYEGNLSQCLEIEKITQDKLLSIDLLPFKKRIRIIGAQKDYLWPYSENQYIYVSNDPANNNKIFSIRNLTAEKITLVVDQIKIDASSQDHGITYQGIYEDAHTGYVEKIVLLPDFKI